MAVYLSKQKTKVMDITVQSDARPELRACPINDFMGVQ
jgi:hypothetical protein